MPIHNNERAFPRPVSSTGSYTLPEQDGMTLRDYFASQALTGLLANSASPLAAWSDYAKDAYALADVMLTEREK